MPIIKYLNLIELINSFPENIDIIKQKHLLLLSELTSVTDLERNIYLEYVKNISQMGSIIVAYIENPETVSFDIIASGTIIIEPKLIRSGKCVGHIEDIVVKNKYRGQSISNDILEVLKNIARVKDCYKVILDCSEEVKKVYKKSNFSESGIQMALYFI